MRWLIVIVIIAAVVFYFLGQQSPHQSPPAPAPTTAAAPQSPQGTPPPMAPPAQAKAPIDINAIYMRMQAAATQARVKLRRLQATPQGGAVVEVYWGGDNATLGADFLDTCIKQGIIRDFDINNKKEGMAMDNGQRIFTAQYLVSF